jgi:hypothetical protein
MPKGCSGTMARTLDDSDAPNTVCEPQSIALLSRTFSRNLLAVDLAEPLSSLDDHQAPTLAFASRSGRDRLSPSEFRVSITSSQKSLRTNMSKKVKTKVAAPEKLASKDYMKELRKLQAELCHLQEWVKHKGLRVIIIFEGRDAAGKVAPFAP